MDNTDVREQPSKKRRFFSEISDDRTHSVLEGNENAFSSPPKLKRRVFDDDGHNPVQASTTAISGSLSSPPIAHSVHGTAFVRSDYAAASTCKRQPQPPSLFGSCGEASSKEDAVFDLDTFEGIVGQRVEPDVMQIIQKICKNDIQKAVNMYFDETWKQVVAPPYHSRLPLQAGPKTGLERGSAEGKAEGKGTKNTPHASHVPSDVKASQRPIVQNNQSSIPMKRYIGAFGVEGWVTRSGTNLLKHGDTVKIERQRIEMPHVAGNKKSVFSKLGPAVAVRANSAAAKRVDVIVRFTSRNGLELGRLSKDAANWVSTLMDQKICEFEGICVYAPERLRTNDTVFLQLRCSLLRSSFEQKPVRPAENRATGLFEEKETAEERDLRLRQVALVRLLQEVNLMPTRINAAAAQRGRQGLLEAVEMAEKREKEPISSGSALPEETVDEPEDGQELEQDQLDALYRKAQSFDFSTPEAEPPNTFVLTLRRYQKQALHWMLSKEKDGAGDSREVSMHPLWEEYAWPVKDVDDNDLPNVPDQKFFYVNPYSGDLSLEFPVQDQHCLGGILADEMGLGKTIQMLSLIHSHQSPIAMEARKQQQRQQQRQQTGGESISSLQKLRRIRSKLPNVVDAPCTTLVVAPMSLLAQWQSEVDNASVEGTLRSIVYYGNDKAADLQAICSVDQAATAPDVVITSYGVVLSEFTQTWSKPGHGEGQPGQGLFSLNFFRIILDEAHTIKNRQSKTAKACYALLAEHRWVLTGTPVVNRLEDLFSLVRFLRVEPWDNFSFWRTFITVPFESKDFMRALDVVQTVLEPLVMRRTKDMKTPDGHPLVSLPAKHIEIVHVELSKTEREIYDHIYMKAKRSFTANMEAGTVMKSFTSIFAQVLRLRQCCCHPVLVRNRAIVADEVEAGATADAVTGLSDDMDLQSLVERFTATTGSPTDMNAFGAHVMGQIRDEASSECPICAEEPMNTQTVTSCWHSACKDCLLKYIEHETNHKRLPRCVHCREIINRRDLFEVVRYDDDPETTGQVPRIRLQRLDVCESSAKVVGLLEHLRSLRRERPTIKSVVFSQFTSFMTLIEPALQRANMKFLRLDGTMAQKTRATVLDEFRQSNKFTVLLISLRAGGVGLNLTAAKRVFLMDPWWSFSVEAQAIDRVHRMGQDEEVKVYRFIVKRSVEEKMLKIQDRKNFIATSLGMMTDEEKKLHRIEDIRELLS